MSLYPLNSEGASLLTEVFYFFLHVGEFLPKLFLSSSFDYGPSISADGSVLCFESARPGGFGDRDLWQAPIVPIVDFDGDGRTDTGDVLIMIDNWGTDETLCDVGPMPWGDGTVDIEDLKVFIKHWEQENMPQDEE